MKMTPCTTASLTISVGLTVIASATFCLPSFAAQQPSMLFENITKESGLTSYPAWKYGGPSTVDINRDGHYDLLLTNHDKWPVQLFYGNENGTFNNGPNLMGQADVHGISAADYDNDGQVDAIITLGGGNGSQPKPPRLFKQNDGKFVDVTEASGLAKMGARGRSARWLDVDNDGDLDLIQINAEKMISEEVPRNLLFINQGDGSFVYTPSPLFEDIDAEKIVVTELNNDKFPDLITFNAYSPLQIWLGQANGQYRNASTEYLPEHLQQSHFVTAVAQTDIDNDGDIDLYLARGKSLYQIANNALQFNPDSGQLDIRDEGNKSHDGISFTSDGPITLEDFYHFPRGAKLNKLPVFIGQHQARIDPPNKPIVITPELAGKTSTKEQNNQTQSGWYISYQGLSAQTETKGQHQWRLDWLLKDNLAWDIRASIKGVKAIQPDWQPQALGVDDILLLNDKGQFTDISTRLPPQSKDNNWGVITADFDNNTYPDFFVYRYGELNQRVEDLLLLNQAGFFEQQFDHGATTLAPQTHGDMGAAFDVDRDGYIDIISGDDNGQWQMYKNIINTKQTDINTTNFINLEIGYSETGIDPLGAKVIIEYEPKANSTNLSTTEPLPATAIMTSQMASSEKAAKTLASQSVIVGSVSAAHSQSLMNIIHFGLGETQTINTITVTWRDDSQIQQRNVTAGQFIKMGK